MINLESEFSPRVNPADANYPFGSIKDNSSPGANDGTPLAAAWGNDFEGFRQAAMTEASIVPSGLPDTAQDSQLLDALDKRYLEIDYQVWTFATGGVLTDCSQAVKHTDNNWYSWNGAFPHTVAPGTDPTAIGSGYVQRGDAYLSHRINEWAVDFATYGPSATVDCTEIFEQAIHDAQNSGKPLYLGNLHLKLSSRSINLLTRKSLVIKGNFPFCTITISGWDSKTNITNHNVTARTQFVYTETDAYNAPHDNDFNIDGVRFVNADTTPTTRLIYASGCFRNVNLNCSDFIGFTGVSVFGYGLLANGVHANSDALTAINETTYYDCLVKSDNKTTGQYPKAFHTYHSMSTQYLSCHLYGYGDGYVVRSDGGAFDTIPVMGRGANNVKMSLCHVYSEATSEYCQATKTADVTISCNTADASNGDKPDNFWDLFNCFGVTFNCNSVRGGGLLFHGHADLNNGSFPNSLVGSHGLSATGNTLINPTHDSVFNLGGDGTVDGNRAYRSAVIADNTVYCEPGFTPPQDCAFLFGFLCNDISLSGNNISGIGTYFRTFYCKTVSINNETLRNVPKEIDNTGNDTLNFRVGTVHRYGTTGSVSKLSGNLLTDCRQVSRQVFENGLVSEKDATVTGIVYAARGDSGYVVNGSVTLNLESGADCGVFELSIVMVEYAGSASFGKYIVVVSGANVIQTTPIVAITGVNISVTSNGASGATITVANTTGQQRVLRAYAARFAG